MVHTGRWDPLNSKREKDIERAKLLHPYMKMTLSMVTCVPLILVPNSAPVDDKVLLIDFDEAGQVDRAFYPLNLNAVDITRPATAIDGTLITKDHDNFMLNQVFYPKKCFHNLGWQRSRALGLLGREKRFCCSGGGCLRGVCDILLCCWILAICGWGLLWSGNDRAQHHDILSTIYLDKLRGTPSTKHAEVRKFYVSYPIT